MTESPQTFSARVVERAFRDETGGATTAAELVLALKRSHHRLADAVSPLVGDAGFDAMFARAVRKALSREPSLDTLVTDEASPFLDQLSAWLEQRTSAEVRAVAVGALSYFVELLTRLIGEALVLQLLQTAWPDAVRGDVPEIP